MLCVADMYLLPGLKRLCGRTLAQILEEDNVVSIWRIAKLFQLTRLEDQCTEYMAKIIEKVAETLPAALSTCAYKFKCTVSCRLNGCAWSVINSCPLWFYVLPEEEQLLGRNAHGELGWSLGMSLQ